MATLAQPPAASRKTLERAEELSTTASGAVGSQTLAIANSRTITAILVAPGENFNRIAGPVLTNGLLRFTFAGIPNRLNALEQTPCLAPPVTWQGLLTNAAAANGMVIFDVQPSATNGATFFRTR